ncbi:MAG: hypothetical protein HUK04_04225 [Bacteroidaceae bacterium]|nr:hypothetical protein [Bacteroidaceae bacterium]
MGMFSTREPRRFNRQPIYFDSHKEEIQRIHDDKLRELGALPPRNLTEEDIRGSFYKATKHLRRRVESGKKPLHPGIIVLIVVFLIALWRWLLT